IIVAVSLSISSFVTFSNEIDNKSKILIESQNLIEEPSRAFDNNDDLNSAENLSPNNYYLLSSYNNSVSSSLQIRNRICDFDLYYFKLLSRSSVSILCTENSTQNYNYNLSIETFEYNDSGFLNGKAARTTKAIYNSTQPSDKNKSFTGTLDPGTYFICLDSDEYLNGDVEIFYTLSIEVNKSQNDNNDEDISFLKTHKSLAGAVWMSDYQPVVFGDYLDPCLKINYYEKDNTGISDIDYTLDDLLLLSNGQEIHYLTYYIWNQEILDIVYDFLYSVHNYFSMTYDIQEEMRIANTELIEEENVIKFVGTIFSMAGLVFNFSIPLKLIGLITFYSSQNLLTQLVDSFFPENSILNAKYWSYITYLMGVTKNIDLSSRVFVLPFFYKLYSEGEGDSKKNYIDFTPTIDAVYEEQLYGINEESISLEDDGLFYCSSSIYGIQYNINGLLTKNVNDFPTTHDYVTYNWKSLTQHVAVCDCGNSIFEGHIISGSYYSTYAIGSYAKCLLCKGNASIGFVNGYALKRNNVVLGEDGLFYPEKTYMSDGNIVLNYQDSITFRNDNNSLSSIIAKL
ncbi:MAG: hypothetical protein ACI4U5_04450, partial [Bacilli bacterium]